MTAALLATLALLVALAALGAALLAWRKADDAQATSRTEPARQPVALPDQRQRDLGPPRLTGERRARDDGRAARHRAPDDERARRADRDDPGWTTRDPDPATVDLRIPPPGSIGLPPPGSIGRRPGA